MNKLRQQVNRVLLALLGNEDLVQRWWTGPNFHFKLRCPQEVWDESEEGQEEVANYVFTHGFR